MKEINLLFLAPHWRVGIVRAFRDAKSSFSFHGKLIGADSDSLSPSLMEVDGSYILPPFSDSNCNKSLIEICERESIRAILPLTNKAVEFLNTHRESFPRSDLLSYLQSPETIEICHDKLKLYEFFQAHKIPSPQTGTPESFFQSGIYPLIAKQRRGEGGKNMFIIENSRDLEFYSARYPDHLIQAFIRGREFSIDWFSDQNKKPIIVVPRERLAIKGGEVRVSRIIMKTEIIEAAKRVGTQLGLTGPCCLQGILSPSGEFMLTDVNLRFGSGANHTFSAGGNIPWMMYKELYEDCLNPDPPPIQDGSVMTRFLDGFFKP